MTDHRIGMTVHNLPGVLEGDLDDLIDALVMADQADRLVDLTGRPMTPPDGRRRVRFIEPRVRARSSGRPTSAPSRSSSTATSTC